MADLGTILFRREMGPDGDIHYPWMSDNALEIFGCPADRLTMTPKGALNAVHWADRDMHVSGIHRSAETMSRNLEAFRVITPNGETKWLRGSATPARQADGTIAWDGAWIDITPWMRAEHQFQTVMDRAEDAILVLGTESGITWVNGAAERLFGWPLVEMLGRCVAFLLSRPCQEPAPLLRSECPHPDLLACFPRGTQEVSARRRDGSEFPFEMTVSEARTDGQLSLIVIGRDITRRRATEQILEETERRLRSIAANLPGVVFQRLLTPEGIFTYSYLSNGIEEILGCSASEILTDPSLLFDAMIDSDRERLLRDLLISAESLAPASEDVRIRDVHGHVRRLAGQSRPRRRDGAIVWDGLILDVTGEVESRHKAERALRDSEERFRMAFSASLQGIAITTIQGQILQANPTLHRLTGLDGTALLGRNIREIIDSDLLPDPTHPLDAESFFAFEYMPHGADGRHRHWRITGTSFSAVSTDEAPSVLICIEDITELVRTAEERRQLEMALIEGQKLEALGRLAGGVAHELNNMLGPILMAAEMILRSGQLDQRNDERVSRIVAAAKHGRDIVHNVLAYCRKEQNILGPLDAAQVFREFADLVASILPPSVRVETNIAVDVAQVMGDAAQLTQVLLNLANNASDAMEGRGTLRLSLAVTSSFALVRSRSRPTGLGDALDFVDIRIRDTGCGMTPEIAARIFDPFFTTKPVGQGTGLGLSVAQGIIKSMGGVILVESTPGEGTQFRLLIPIPHHPLAFPRLAGQSD